MTAGTTRSVATMARSRLQYFREMAPSTCCIAHSRDRSTEKQKRALVGGASHECKRTVTVRPSTMHLQSLVGRKRGRAEAIPGPLGARIRRKVQRRSGNGGTRVKETVRLPDPPPPVARFNVSRGLRIRRGPIADAQHTRVEPDGLLRQIRRKKSALGLRAKRAARSLRSASE